MGGAERIGEDKNRGVLWAGPLVIELSIGKIGNGHREGAPWSARCWELTSFRNNAADEFLGAAEIVSHVEQAFEVGRREMPAQPRFLAENIFQLAFLFAGFLAGGFNQKMCGHFAHAIAEG